MTVQELVERINDDNFDLNEALEIKQYIPLDAKKMLAYNTLYESIDDNGQTDSIQKRIVSYRNIILTHTNLEYTDEDYDILHEVQFQNQTLFDVIMAAIKNDAAECFVVIDLVFEDYIRNNNIQSVIKELINNIADRLKPMIDNISKMDLEALLPNDIDKQQLSKFLNEYVR